MLDHRQLQLGVNVDHIATLRQARGVCYPDPAHAAQIAQQAGADGITVHLREDRRHIQDSDVFKIKQATPLPLNFEMAATLDMLKIAIKLQPYECCLVPEKRQELTTEGGLDVVSQLEALRPLVSELQDNDIMVSLFIDPDENQISASKELEVNIVELHTGSYAENDGDQPQELMRIENAARFAHGLGVQVNAGHGLNYDNVQAIAAIPNLVCLNIGHAIVARAVISGFYEAVSGMRKIINDVRLESAS